MLEGEIDEARGKMLEAIQAYHQALAQQDVGEIAVKIYGAEVRGGDKHGAFTRLNQWLDAHPEDPVARATIGDVSLANGDYRGAATHSERVMKIPQVPSLVRNSVEWAYFELKAPQALAAAEAAYKATAVSGLIADTLGWILAEQGDVARGGTTAQACSPPRTGQSSDWLSLSGGAGPRWRSRRRAGSTEEDSSQRQNVRGC